MTSTPSRKRKNITFEEKYEIIKDKQKGISVKELIEKYGRSSSTKVFLKSYNFLYFFFNSNGINFL